MQKIYIVTDWSVSGLELWRHPFTSCIIPRLETIASPKAQRSGVEIVTVIFVLKDKFVI